MKSLARRFRRGTKGLQTGIEMFSQDDLDEERKDFKQELKCFHKTFKKKIEWLKEHGFHELIDNEYLTVEFRTRSCNGSYLSVNPDLDGSQWQCIACIDGVWDYDTEAISRHHPNLAIRKSKNCMEKKVQRRFLRLYKNFEEK